MKTKLFLLFSFWVSLTSVCFSQNITLSELIQMDCSDFSCMNGYLLKKGFCFETDREVSRTHYYVWTSCEVFYVTKGGCALTKNTSNFSISDDIYYKSVSISISTSSMTYASNLKEELDRLGFKLDNELTSGSLSMSPFGTTMLVYKSEKYPGLTARFTTSYEVFDTYEIPRWGFSLNKKK